MRRCPRILRKANLLSLLLLWASSWHNQRKPPQQSFFLVVMAAAASSRKEPQDNIRRVHFSRQSRRRKQASNAVGMPTTLDLHSVTVHEHHRRLLHANMTSATTAALASWRALGWFQATRHLSRYEYAHRKREGLDLMLRWNGVYNETGTEENGAGGSSSSFLGFSLSDDRRRRLMNMSNWISTAAHTDSYQAVPLSQGYGTHLANVWVGSPHPQRKTVIVDTGSHFTAFPCQGCRNCGGSYHTDPYFDPHKSDTFHQLQCDECIGVMCEESRCFFSQSYTEGSSWDAIQVKDRFYCAGMDVLDAVEPTDLRYAIDFMFGCMTKVNGLFLTQLADGIMGMSAHEATLTKQLWNKGVLEHNMFALCFRRELGTSKRGVAAGSMTLGGVSTNLDSSPVIYAKNMAKSGWFTVYVKNIYVRAGGGQSAAPTPGTRTVRVNVDLAALNSGKGVIVDSGTTDTYLNKAVAPAFRRAWKSATGKPYSHFPLRLTDEELARLPTVLVQCHAYATVDPAVEDYSTIPGYVGNLDSSSPNDLLIAIPATSYMDYSPITKMYTSRLYLTETSGGVLGSNTMQGHNVVFDWRLGRIGFAESSCTYDKRDFPAELLSDEDGYPADCVVNQPILTTTCFETVDASLCEANPTNIAVLGTRKWTALVENPGTSAGLTCQETAGGGKRNAEVKGERKVVCRGDGVCEEERDCQFTCKELGRASKVQPKPDDNEKLGCGDSYWSACDRACRQTRLQSESYSDGFCHETSRDSRPCHTGACMRESPCLVPYLVHVVLGFHGLAIRDWTFAADDAVSKALVKTASKLLGENAFAEGDVNVVFSLPWYLEEDDPEAAFRHKSDGEVKPVGVKVVVDVSIVNYGYNKTSLPVYDPSSSSALEKLLTNWTIYEGQAIKCSEVDLHRLAKLALRLKKEVLMAPAFMTTLIKEMRHTEATKTDTPYFAPVLSRQAHKNASRLISTWSVPTGVDEEINFYGPHRPMWYILIRVLHVCTIILMVFMLVWSLGGASSTIRDICLRYGFRWRRSRYIAANTTEPSEEHVEEDGAVTLELAVHSPRRHHNGTVLKRKGSQQPRIHGRG